MRLGLVLLVMPVKTQNSIWIFWTKFGFFFSSAIAKDKAQFNTLHERWPLQSVTQTIDTNKWRMQKIMTASKIQIRTKKLTKKGGKVRHSVSDKTYWNEEDLVEKPFWEYSGEELIELWEGKGRAAIFF